MIEAKKGRVLMLLDSERQGKTEEGRSGRRHLHGMSSARVVLDNVSPHLSTKVDSRVGDWGLKPTTWSWPTCRPAPAG